MPSAGMRAGLFHPTTGYSLPEAVRLADAIAAMPSLESAPLAAWVRRRAVKTWHQGRRFFRLLNRMLFRAAEPERRFHVLEQFYRLPEETLGRFYAGRLSDKAGSSRPPACRREGRRAPARTRAPLPVRVKAAGVTNPARW